MEKQEYVKDIVIEKHVDGKDYITFHVLRGPENMTPSMNFYWPIKMETKHLAILLNFFNDAACYKEMNILADKIKEYADVLQGVSGICKK